jgi:hypothetical protein
LLIKYQKKHAPELRARNLSFCPKKSIRFGGSWLLACPLAILLLEPLNPPGGVNKLHLACEKRVARGANFHTNRFPGATGGEFCPATTGDGGFIVIGMDVLLHGY